MAQFMYNQNIFSANNADSGTFLDAGIDSDGAFNAMAAGMLNQYLSNPGKASNILLSGLITAFYQCYPGSKPTFIHSGALNVSERFHFLKNTYGIRNLVAGFGFVLRQLAVKELIEHSKEYPLVYCDYEALLAMREPGAILPEKTLKTAMTALARRLHLNIKMSASESRKELGDVIDYQPTEAVKISIDKRDNDYRARVHNKFLSDKRNDSLPKPQYLWVELPEKSQWEQLGREQGAAICTQFDYIEKNLHKAAPSMESLSQHYIERVSERDFSQAIVHHMDFEKDIQHFISAVQGQYSNKALHNLAGAQTDFSYYEMIRGLASEDCVQNASEIEKRLDTIIEQGVHAARSSSTF